MLSFLSVLNAVLQELQEIGILTPMRKVGLGIKMLILIPGFWAERKHISSYEKEIMFSVNFNGQQ